MKNHRVSKFSHLLFALFAAGLPPVLAQPTNGPAAATAQPQPAPAPQFRVIDANTLAVGLVTVHKQERTFTLPAKVNMNERVIEYALVTDAGKTHESLFATDAKPRDIHLAALLLGVVPAAELGQTNAFVAIPAGSGLRVEVQWSAEGKECRHPLEQLISLGDPTQGKTIGTLTNSQWLYTGSRMDNGRFAADADGSIISLIRDSIALLNNPGPSRGNDDIHFPAKSLLPTVGSPVTVTFRLPVTTTAASPPPARAASTNDGVGPH
jgi:hypothetical protein